jgi:hypothetical protein
MDETVVQALHKRNSTVQSKHFMCVTQGFFDGHEPYHYLCHLFNELPKAKSLE